MILERQITMEEIALCAAAARDCGIDLEVFIHGSMCASLSGRCLWSSALGGESGNRGCCKQPCRREYALESGSGRGRPPAHWLSMHDMSAPAMLPRLMRMGIKSFKIEGRLRSPDYVAKVVDAYVFLRDAILTAAGKDDADAAVAEAENRLSRTPARFPGPGPALEPNSQWLKPFEAAAFGVAAAEVKAVTARGIAIKAAQRMHLGDRLRIVPAGGGEGEAFTLTGLFRRVGERDEAVKTISGGEAFIPGDFRGLCRAGAALRKIGESNASFRRRSETLPPWRTLLAMEVECGETFLTLKLPGRGISVSTPHEAGEARRHELTRENLEELFASGAPLPWQPTVTVTRLAPGLFIPASRQKMLRRALWEELAAKLTGAPRKPEAEAGAGRFREWYRLRTHPDRPTAPAGCGWRMPAFIPAGDEKRLTARIVEQIGKGCVSIGVTSFGALSRVPELRKQFPEVRFTLTPPAPVTNSLASEVAAEWGISACEAWPELESGAVTALTEASPIPVLPSVETPPLLVTRAALPEGVLRDRAGRRFRIARMTDEPLVGLYAEDDDPLKFWRSTPLK